MNKKAIQLDLFQSSSLNITYEIKRSIRLALSDSNISREQICDSMNKIAIREGMRKSISKSTIDNWSKDSDPDRLPSIVWLTIFCKVLNDPRPLSTLLTPLGYGLIDSRKKVLLNWAESEMNKRKATKKAKLALAQLEEL